MAENGIGAAVRRKEDKRFITGAGTYTDDINRPGQAFAYFVRSPYPHATINGIDKAAAEPRPACSPCSPATMSPRPAGAG